MGKQTTAVRCLTFRCCFLLEPVINSDTLRAYVEKIVQKKVSVQIFGTGAEFWVDVAQDELSRLKLDIGRREKLVSGQAADAFRCERAPL